MNNYITLLAAIIGSGAIATVIVAYMGRDKTTAEALVAHAQSKDILTQATERAVSILSDQLEAARKRIDDLEAEVAALHREIERLIRQLDVVTKGKRD